MMGRVRHEILYIQVTKVFGRVCQSHSEHISQELIVIVLSQACRPMEKTSDRGLG